jgi:hypothetical protein
MRNQEDHMARLANKEAALFQFHEDVVTGQI